MKTMIQHLRRAALLQQGDGPSDARLLESFVSRQEEAAFEALLRRHGPLVLGVCRRVLGHVQDAEDAFQATFLVLVRKASSIRPRDQVGPWLYGVAYRTALKMRAMTAKRRSKERDRPRPQEPEESCWQEWLPLLDRELSRLPEKYRVPVVLCELQGKSRKEAARLLQLPEGTLSSRLASARKMLARGLSSHGAAVPAGMLAVLLGTEALAAQVPPALLASTLKAAGAFVAAAVPAGVIPPPIVALTEGVLKTMLLNRLKVVTTVLLGLACVGLFAAAGPLLLLEADEPRSGQSLPERAGKEPPQKPIQAVIEEVNPGDRALTLIVLPEAEKEAGKKATRLENVPVAAEARILIKERQSRLSDLRGGMRISLRLEVQGNVVVKEVQATEADTSRELKRTQQERLSALGALEEAARQGDLDARISAARSDLTMWEERAAWSKRMSRPDRQYVTVAQAEADQARLRAARAQLIQLEQERQQGPASSAGGREKSITDLLTRLIQIKEKRAAALDREWNDTLALLRARIERQRKALDEAEEQLRKLAAEGSPVKEPKKPHRVGH